MNGLGVHVVTGAFGYSGRYIARRLVDQGCTVRTLTNSPRPAGPLGEAVAAMPFHFDQPVRLAESLAGVSVLYNTYWVRFNHRNFTFAEAVRNSRTLFGAARQAAWSGSYTRASRTPRSTRHWSIFAARRRWRRP